MKIYEYIETGTEKVGKAIRFLVPFLALAGTFTLIIASVINKKVILKHLTEKQLNDLVNNAFLHSNAFLCLFLGTLFLLFMTPILLDEKKERFFPDEVYVSFDFVFLLITASSLMFTISEMINAAAGKGTDDMVIFLFIFVICVLILCRKMLRIIVKKIKKVKK